MSPLLQVVISGRNVFMGYLNNPEKTQQVFTEDGYLRSGDYGCLDKDKHLFITGRIKGDSSYCLLVASTTRFEGLPPPHLVSCCAVQASLMCGLCAVYCAFWILFSLSHPLPSFLPSPHSPHPSPSLLTHSPYLQR